MGRRRFFDAEDRPCIRGFGDREQQVVPRHLSRAHLTLQVALKRTSGLQPTARDLNGTRSESVPPVGFAHLTGNGQSRHGQLGVELDEFGVGHSSDCGALSRQPQRCAEFDLVLPIAVVAGDVVVEVSHAEGRRAGREPSRGLLAR